MHLKDSSETILKEVRTGLADPWADQVSITVSRRDARYLERSLQRTR